MTGGTIKAFLEHHSVLSSVVRDEDQNIGMLSVSTNIRKKYKCSQQISVSLCVSLGQLSS